jgi:hypothetical protein
MMHDSLPVLDITPDVTETSALPEPGTVILSEGPFVVSSV